MRRPQSLFYTFLNRINYTDYALFYLIITILLTAFTFILVNTLDFHYPSGISLGNQQIDWQSLNLFFWNAIGPSLAFLFYGIYIRETYPHAATFLWGTGFLPLCLLTSMIIGGAIQTTPFSPIDLSLVKIDHFFGINTPLLMAWTHAHPRLHHLLTDVYYSLALELFAVPILLTILCQRKPLTLFYLAQLSCILIGTCLYYFFPTMAPSGVLHSPYFTAAQKGTSLHFYELHHYLKNTVDQAKSGLIAFPSFHVIWAILLTNALRSIKPLFYPAIIWNSILIVSTVLLGWHYFADVVGGVVIACVGILFANGVYAKDG